MLHSRMIVDSVAVVVAVQFLSGCPGRWTLDWFSDGAEDAGRVRDAGRRPQTDVAPNGDSSVTDAVTLGDTLEDDASGTDSDPSRDGAATEDVPALDAEAPHYIDAPAIEDAPTLDAAMVDSCYDASENEGSPLLDAFTPAGRVSIGISFSSAVKYSVGPTAQAMVLADFNRDGLLDLVTANASPNTSDNGSIGILFGSGGGTFSPQAILAGNPQRLSVAAADVNGDGILDIVTANLAMGSYRSTVYPCSPVSFPCTMETVDDTNGTVSVFLGVGDGTFLSEVQYDVLVRPLTVTLGDVDGDGLLDVITIHRATTYVPTYPPGFVVHRGLGDGKLDKMWDFFYLANSNPPSSLALGNFNRDEFTDVVIAPSGANSVDLTLGKHLLPSPSGVLDLYYNPTSFPITGCANSVAVGDPNLDGIQDLVVGCTSGGTVSVLLGIGDGTFSEQTPVSIGASPSFVQVVDIDLDGNPDVVSANGNTAALSVLLGAGDGTLHLAKNFPDSGHWSSLLVNDLDNDGRPDVLGLDSSGTSVSVLLHPDGP